MTADKFVELEIASLLLPFSPRGVNVTIFVTMLTVNIGKQKIGLQAVGQVQIRGSASCAPTEGRKNRILMCAKINPCSFRKQFHCLHILIVSISEFKPDI